MPEEMPRTMKAAVLRDRKIEFKPEFPVPLPMLGEARIRVDLAGICGTDLEMLHGYKRYVRPAILGHEFVGSIESINARRPSEFNVGDRVVAEINCVPDEWQTSGATERAHHQARQVLGIMRRNGAFAQFVCVPLVNLHRVPDILLNTHAVFAEPLAAACRVLEQVHVRPGDGVAVLGAGKLGLLVAQVLRAYTPGAVSVLVRRRKACPFLTELGLNSTLVCEASPRSFHTVVDCTGQVDGLKTAIGLVRAQGTVVLKSTLVMGMGRGIDMTEVVVRELRLVGSRCGPLDAALKVLEEGKVKTEELVEKVYPIEEVEDAMIEAEKRGTLKILLRMNS